jgi:tetratricopeptide (TPR) repeat protein
MALEEGNLLRAANKDSEAATVYRRVWQAGKEGHYSGLHYETSALSLGDLLRDQKDYARAASSYDMVNGIPQPDSEILRKSNLGAGEMYDMLRNRDLALKRYEQVVAVNVTSPQADEARKYIQDPYKGD